MKLITHIKSNYTSALTRCGVIIRDTVHINAAYVRKYVHSFNIVYVHLAWNLYVYMNKFITNKLYLSMNREPILHVSAIIYSHFEGWNNSGNM